MSCAQEAWKGPVTKFRYQNTLPRGYLYTHCSVRLEVKVHAAPTACARTERVRFMRTPIERKSK
jgi:hypothetical protein